MEGILSNRWFILIQLLIVGGQILIIFLGGKAFSVQPLDQASQWAVSVLLGALAVPLAVIIRLIPDQFITKLILYMGPRTKSPELGVPGESRQYGWNTVLEEIRDYPVFMKKVRGGRLRHIIHNIAKICSSPAAAHIHTLLRCPRRLETRRPMTTSWLGIWHLHLHLSGHL